MGNHKEPTMIWDHQQIHLNRFIRQIQINEGLNVDPKVLYPNKKYIDYIEK